MKSSDHFKSMDEVREFAEKFKAFSTEEEYKSILKLCGLGEQEGLSETIYINGAPCEIDKFLIPMVLDLNERGLETLASCSGLYNEHMSLQPSGYISLYYRDGLLEKLQEVFSGTEIQVEETECYLKRAICLKIKYTTEEEMEKKWQELWVGLVSI